MKLFKNKLNFKKILNYILKNKYIVLETTKFNEY